MSYMVCNFSDHVHYQIPQFVYWKLLNILCLCVCVCEMTEGSGF